MNVLAELIKGPPMPRTVHLKEGNLVDKALASGNFNDAVQAAEQLAHGPVSNIVFDFIEPPPDPRSTKTA